MTDVTVVGAGPAGSSVALRLARKGYAVTILERARFPRVKVCGDYLCPDVAAALAELGQDTGLLVDAHQVRSVALEGFGLKLEVEIPSNGALSMPRAILDLRLLTAARAAGASVVVGSFLRSDDRGNRLKIRFRDEHGAQRELDTRVLIAADGAWSSVATRAEMAESKRTPGRWALGGELPVVENSQVLQMYVGEGGYYARNPLSPTTANSMLVVPKPPPPRELDAVVTRLTNGKVRFEREKMHRPVSVGPLRYRARVLAKGNILLTGDAAELLDPFIGQGVATALRVSLPASIAAHDLLCGEPPARVAQRYHRAWSSIVAPRRRLGALVTAMVGHRWLRERIVRSFRRNSELSRQLVASVSGTMQGRELTRPLRLLELFAS